MVVQSTRTLASPAPPSSPGPRFELRHRYERVTVRRGYWLHVVHDTAKHLDVRCFRTIGAAEDAVKALNHPESCAAPELSAAEIWGGSVMSDLHPDVELAIAHREELARRQAFRERDTEPDLRVAVRELAEIVWVVTLHLREQARRDGRNIDEDELADVHNGLDDLKERLS